MSLPRLRSVRLTYGCHDRDVTLPDRPSPVVIAGPNGSGKTTLLEALLRGLYGFSRRKPEERDWLESRHPWSGKPTRSEIVLRSADGREVSITREFDTDEVVARCLDTDVELFRGDANPVGVRSENQRYRELLGEWIGFATLEPYRKTAWIGQGELVDTELDDELLRAAAGTHRRVETAQDELRKAHDELTRDPIELGGRRKNRPRPLERLREEADRLSDRLATARAARERRRPLRESAARLADRAERVEADIGLLETAYRPLAERRTLVAEEGRARDRLEALTEALRWMEDAERVAGTARAEAESAAGEGIYPDDLESRLGEARVLWERRQAIGGEPGSARAAPEAAPTGRADRLALGTLGGGALLLVLAIAFHFAGLSGPAVASGLVGLGGLAAGWHRIRHAGTGAVRGPEGERLRAEWLEIERRLSRLADGVPGPALSPDSFPLHRERFRHQEEAREALAAARSRLADATERARRLLPEPVRGDTGEPPDAVSVRRGLAAAEDEARTALARAQLRLEEQPALPELPEGVEPTVAAVDVARSALRDERAGLAEEQARLDLELRDMERASEDAFALERELTRLRERIAEIEDEIVVRRAAWELVRDAYAEFREHDQDRLLAAVNRHVGSLAGGRLGPIESDGELTAARIRLEGRPVQLESPPLSFGEKHVALLAIRLGAADFLAGDGVRHPLLVDEPFTHLDEARSAQVWRLLCGIAADRQVIVTTQDRLVLEYLGVEPDIRLAGAAEADAGDASASSPPYGAVAAPGVGTRIPSRDADATGDGRAREPDRTRPGNPDEGVERDAPEQAQLELG